MSMEHYDKYLFLIEHYSRYYPNPHEILESIIRNMMEQEGLSREEAINRLYFMIISSHSRGDKLGVIDVLSSSLNYILKYPQILLSILLGGASEIITSITVISLILFLLNQPDILKVFSSLETGSLTNIPGFLMTIIRYLKPAIIIAGIAYIISLSLGEGVTGSFLFNASKILWTKGRFHLRDFITNGISSLKESILAAFLKNILVFSPTIFLGFLILDAIETLSTAIFENLSTLVSLLLSIILVAIYLLVISLLLYYSVLIASLEKKGPLDSLKDSVKIFLKIPGRTIIFILVILLLRIFIGVFSQILSYSYFDILGFSSLINILFISSIEGLGKILLYLEVKGEKVIIASTVRKSLLREFLKNMKDGLVTIKSFIYTGGKYILASISIFTLSFVLGFLIGPGENARKFLNLILDNPVFEELPVILTTDIFFHNWYIASYTVFSAIFTPLAPIVIAIINGYIIGLVASIVEHNLFIASVLPHGIIEIPGFIISVAAGLELSITYLTSKERFIEEVDKFSYIILGLIPIFFVAAIIETFVTPFIMKLVTP